VLRQVGVQQFCEIVSQGGLRLGFAGVGRLVHQHHGCDCCE
jgi:hypothetical protein